MASFDVDRFRRFVESDNFRTVYILSDDEFNEVVANDISLLQLGYRIMRKVFFAENSIQMAEGILEKRVEERKDHIEVRRMAEVEKARRKDEEKWKKDNK